MTELAITSRKSLLQRIEDMLGEYYMNVGKEVRGNFDRFATKAALGKPIYAKNVKIGKNIYNLPLNSDFFLFAPQFEPVFLAIKCFWQTKSGSAERKRPFDVLSAEAGPFQTIFVVDGTKISTGANTWLKGRVGNGKVYKVLNFQQFQHFYVTELSL